MATSQCTLFLDKLILHSFLSFPEKVLEFLNFLTGLVFVSYKLVSYKKSAFCFGAPYEIFLGQDTPPFMTFPINTTLQRSSMRVVVLTNKDGFTRGNGTAPSSNILVTFCNCSIFLPFCNFYNIYLRLGYYAFKY